MGGIANTDQDGAASAGFHSEPDVIESADRQLWRGLFGNAYAAASYPVGDP